MADEPESKPDKYESRLTQSIDNLRGNVKWTLIAFGAIGTILLAGSQLSSIGKFALSDLRLWAAVIFAMVALVAAVCAVGSALSVINTGYVEFDHLDQTDIAYLERNPAMLEGFRSHQNLKQWHDNCISERFEIISNANVNADDFANNTIWFKYLDGLVDAVLSYVQYDRIRKQADKSRTEILWASGIAAVGLLGFAWAANPKDEPATVVLHSPAAEAALTLTDRGRAVLGPVLGGICIKQDKIPVIALSIAPTGSEVLILKSKECNLARFTITDALGKLSNP
jgi:hypothetical protein